MMGIYKMMMRKMKVLRMIMMMMRVMRTMMMITGMKRRMRMRMRMRMTMRMQIDARQCGDCSFKSVFPNFTATCTLCVNCVNFTCVKPVLNQTSLC